MMLHIRPSLRGHVCASRQISRSALSSRNFDLSFNQSFSLAKARHFSMETSIEAKSQPPRLSKLQVTSNWHTLNDQSLSRGSLRDLFENSIPSIRHTGFLSREECRRVVDVIQSHRVGCYDQKMVFPRVGSIGITQFDNRYDKKAYFDNIDEARSLQDRIKQETQVDIVGRVAQKLQDVTGLETRIAREGDKEYFCGLLRVVDNYIQIHPDFGEYDGPDWEIGQITGQLTWNILLKQVPGGDTIIYDRQWKGIEDDRMFQKDFPRYAYKPTGVQGNLFKALPVIEGDLTFFNPRNFHEVKPCDRAWDRPEELVRYTLSSFVGLLPGKNGSPPCLIMWS